MPPSGHLGCRGLFDPQRSAVFEPFKKASGRRFELGEVVCDGGRQYGVGSVEVAVGESVAHPGDLWPGKCRLRAENVVGEAFNGFADLDKTDLDGVEDEPIMEVSALEVGGDGINGGEDIL